MPSAKDRARIIDIERGISEWTSIPDLDAYIVELHAMPKASEIDDVISTLLDYRFVRNVQEQPEKPA